ncbi:unnamed protein product [Phytophthora lilii]|uniref:Unnamed protein product n=1 Tax=Phytophthora lilii TaxID=2077276 RepID=A0A9W6TN11_9STRA|nr:unnamed protein product [Phytophthora lilii]
MEETTTKSKSAEEDDGQEVLTTIENEGPLRRKSLLANPSSASPKKVYPAGGNLDLSIKSSSLEKKSSHAKAQTQAKNLPRPPQGVSSIVYSVVICLAVCICLAWTFWLILLNVAPNDTVNRVMDTEAFEYGSFWLMVNPSSTLMGLATLGLSVIEAGYLVVLIKLLLSCRRNSKLAYVVNQSGKKVHFAHRVEMGQDGAAETPAPTKWTTRIMEFIYAVAQEDSEGRKYIVSSSHDER